MRAHASSIVAAFTIGLFSVFCAIQLAYAQGESKAQEAVVTTPTAAHFMTPDDKNVVVEPGSYKVDVVKQSLRLSPLDGRPAVVVAADEDSPHGEEIDGPTALAFAGQADQNRDLLHVALLLPDGRFFTAIGSISGIRPRGLLDRAKRRQTTRQEIRANRQSTRQEIRADRDKDGVNLLSASKQRRDTRQENRAARQETRQVNRLDRRGIPGTEAPAVGNTGHNAFNLAFNANAATDATTNTPHWPNAYLLTYLTTLVYPEFLDQRKFEVPGKYYLWQDSKAVEGMHKDPQSFIDKYEVRTKHLFAPAGGTSNVQFAFLRGSGLDSLRSGNKRLGWDPEAVVISTSNAVLVVLRGTDVVPGGRGFWSAEWRSTNFRAALISPDHEKLRPGNEKLRPGKVHRGFWNSLVLAEPTVFYPPGNGGSNPAVNTNDGFAEAINDLLSKYDAKNKKLWITGHSLGGAHAQLLATYLAVHPKNPFVAQGVYAIASPRVGDETFTKKVSELFNKGHERRLLRFEFMDDPVPVAQIRSKLTHAGCRIFYTALTGDYPNVRSAPGKDCVPEVELGRAEAAISALNKTKGTHHYPQWYLWSAYGELDKNTQSQVPDRRSLPLPTLEGDIYSDATVKGIENALGL